MNIDKEDWYNLSYYCQNASLVVSPKRGTAIMWYNHFVDEKVKLRSNGAGEDIIILCC